MLSKHQETQKLETPDCSFAASGWGQTDVHRGLIGTYGLEVDNLNTLTQLEAEGNSTV